MEEETEFAASQINWNEIEFKFQIPSSPAKFLLVCRSPHIAPLTSDSWLLLRVDADGCLFIVSAVVKSMFKIWSGIKRVTREVPILTRD